MSIKIKFILYQCSFMWNPFLEQKLFNYFRSKCAQTRIIETFNFPKLHNKRLHTLNIHNISAYPNGCLLVAIWCKIYFVPIFLSHHLPTTTTTTYTHTKKCHASKLVRTWITWHQYRTNNGWSIVVRYRYMTILCLTTSLKRENVM